MNGSVSVEDTQGDAIGSGARVASSLEERIDRSPGWAFAWLSLAYVAIVAVLSSFKLLWLDELITLSIARSGGVGAIWHALASGADSESPRNAAARPVEQGTVRRSRLRLPAARSDGVLGRYVFPVSIPAQQGPCDLGTGRRAAVDVDGSV